MIIIVNMKDRYLYGKKALVTGATSGIGEKIAIALASAGYTVYGVSRHAPEKEERIGAGTLILRKMDITDEESIRNVLDEIGSFALLVQAAGFGIAGPAEDSDISLVRAQFETNYFGSLTLTRLASPVLRSNKRSMIIAVSSVAGRVPLPYQSHYSCTKYALEAFYETLRIEGKPFGLTVAIIEPGDLHTGFTARRKSAIPSGSPYSEYYNKALKQIEHDELSGKGPEVISDAVMKIVRRRNPPVRTVVGINYKALTFLLRFLPDRLVLFILGRMYHAE